MIKVIKEGKLLKLPKEEYRITCEECLTIFECVEDDCTRKVVGHGRMSQVINCPVCGHRIVEEMNPNWECVNVDAIRAVQDEIWAQADERKKLLKNA